MKCTIYFCILFLISCGDQKSSFDPKKPVIEANKHLSFYTENGKHPESVLMIPYKNKVMVMTTSLECYSQNLDQVIQRINLFGKSVEIDSISQALYSLTNSNLLKDFHHFVKIKLEDRSVWVYGKDLFEFIEQFETKVSVDGTAFRFIPTRFLQKRPAFTNDENKDQMYEPDCINPLVIYNGKNKQYAMIEVDAEQLFHSKYMTFSIPNRRNSFREPELKKGKLNFNCLYTISPCCNDYFHVEVELTGLVYKGKISERSQTCF